MSWKTCTSCRKGIDFDTIYWECSVSTCNRKRLGLYFCAVACWDAHLPEARHREAWAIEKRSPGKSEWEREESQASASSASRAVVQSTSSSQPARRTVSSSSSAESGERLPSDVLVVVSKLKNYVKARGDMKTSESVIPVLSQELRRICDKAIRIAGQSGRKTILDRDVRDALKD